MGSNTFILICAAEVVAALLFFIAILAFKNRKLHQLLGKLKTRVIDIKSKLDQLSSHPPESPAPTQPSESYRDKLNHQLEATKSYHNEQGSQQDIALDLDPDAPLTRRTAALRNAFLIAEKEATSDASDNINWEFLANRYQQLLDFNSDYAPAPSQASSNTETEELENLKQELELKQKRINNLDRFKAMYLELEERWGKCEKTANEHYIELKNINVNDDQKENFDELLTSYKSSYQTIGDLFSGGADQEASQPKTTVSTENQSQELTRLRTVAADQHKIINDLQQQLRNTQDTQEQLEIMDVMQGELKKQARFLQESETCVQLMDNELSTAKKELDHLRNSAQEIPQLRATIKELLGATETHEQLVGTLEQKNEHLTKQLKKAQNTPAINNPENHELRNELSSLQANYNDLEERFLDLKTQG